MCQQKVLLALLAPSPYSSLLKLSRLLTPLESILLLRLLYNLLNFLSFGNFHLFVLGVDVPFGDSAWFSNKFVSIIEFIIFIRTKRYYSLYLSAHYLLVLYTNTFNFFTLIYIDHCIPIYHYHIDWLHY